MIADRKKFYTGLGLLVSFSIILTIIFSPVFGGRNGLNYLDSLYNSISKGSAYYIPAVKEETAEVSDQSVSADLTLGSEIEAAQVADLLEKSGIRTSTAGKQLNISGKLGGIFANCLEDAELMYVNNGEAIRSKYGMEEKRVLYNWHSGLKAMEKDLNRQKKFKDAKYVALVIDKAVDLSYNYYGIESKKISECAGVVLFSLVFYVIYTLWFGFSILLLFEGWGIRLDH